MITEPDYGVEFQCPADGAMRIFVYEAVTDGGEMHPESLVVEGRAMRSAIIADLAAVPGVEVLECAGRPFDVCVAAADGVLLIAPETNGMLTALADRVERLNGRLLSPSSPFCRWASDKTATAATLRSAGVPMPEGRLHTAGMPSPEECRDGFVVKPNDGCGSQSVRRITAAAAATFDEQYRDGEWRIERFVPGLAASVALMRGPAEFVALPACSQHLADDGMFRYLGGRCPLSPGLAGRARELALRAAAAMPSWHGYVGVDLVLGDDESGANDYVIEVNPRLTTSYLGLRACDSTNLARAMLDIIAGRPVELSFDGDEIEFRPDGTVCRMPSRPREPIAVAVP